MRLKITIGDESSSFIKISRDYRRYFVAFTKSAFEKSGIFSELYQKKELKPFTFSVFLGKNFTPVDEEKGKDIIIKPPFYFLFSSGNSHIFSNFYNGILEMKKRREGVILSDSKSIPVKKIDLEKNVKIKERCVIFKTLGICILTNPEENARNFEKWFVVPSEENLKYFNKILEKRMIEKYEIINGKKIDTRIIFTPLSQNELTVLIRQGKVSYESFYSTGKSIKEVYVKHYNGFLKGFKGVFLLESHPEMLQFIYDYGLGVRTGQGFGLIEMVKEL